MCINRFKHVLNRYDNPTLKDECYSGLEMDYAMKSINLPDEQYTNFVKTDQNQQYKLLKQIYHDYKQGKNVLNRFQAYDVELYSKNTQRLANILSYNNMKKFSKARTSTILKYHLIEDNSKFRLYIEKDKNNKLIVRLIDLYHLAIPSSHRGISADIMKERTYNEHKHNKTNINKIKCEYQTHVI